MPANYRQLLGRRISASREKAKLTQQELGDRIGKGGKFLSDIERGVKLPSMETIFALAKALKVSPSVFFTFEREETDSTLLREAVAALLVKCDPKQLQRIHRVVKAMVEP
jgi:transcriptional regulator with XRE-family HTH domain